jgi:hypothetical protein
MADVQVNVKVDAKQADDSFRGLTKQLKELRVEQSRVTEGSKEWKKLGKEINDLEGRLGDLGDRFNTLRGSGVERLNSSFGLLREGLVSADFGKAKIALQGIGQAMKAIPILLIVTGIMKLIENFDKLKTSGGLLGKVFTAIGEGIDWVVEKLETFADFIGIIDKDLMDMGDALKANIKASTEALAGQISEYDRQIKVASSAGKKTIDLEIAKQKAIIDTNTALIKQTLEYMKQGQTLTEEEKKILSSQIENLKNATTEIKAIRNKAREDEKKENKKNADERLKDNEALNKKIQDQQIELIKNEKKREESKLMLDLERQKEDIKKSKANREIKNKALLLAEETYQKNLADINKKFADKAEEERKKAEEEEKKRLADIASNNKAQQEQALNELKNLLALRLDLTAQGSEEQLNARLNQLETEKQLELQKYAEGTEERILLEQKFQERKDALQREFRMKQIKEDLETASNSISSLQGLSDTFFAIQQANQKEGSEDAERNAKKQFQINKSLQISAAVVNGLQSILAITSVPDFTLGVVTATRIAAQVALNAATIAKIAGQQYKSSGSGAGTVQTPRNNTPSVNTPTPQQTTLPGQDGTFIQPDNKVYVLESDITKTQGRVARVGEQSKF